MTTCSERTPGKSIVDGGIYLSVAIDDDAFCLEFHDFPFRLIPRYFKIRLNVFREDMIGTLKKLRM